MVGRLEGDRGASRHRVDSDVKLGGTISENEGTSQKLSPSLSLYLSISFSPQIVAVCLFDSADHACAFRPFVGKDRSSTTSCALPSLAFRPFRRTIEFQNLEIF